MKGRNKILANYLYESGWKRELIQLIVSSGAHSAAEAHIKREIGIKAAACELYRLLLRKKMLQTKGNERIDLYRP